MCLHFEQSTWRGSFEPSASHGCALNEVFSSLVQHPIPRHTAKLLRNFPVIACRQISHIKYEKIASKRSFSKQERSSFQASLEELLSCLENHSRGFSHLLYGMPDSLYVTSSHPFLRRLLALEELAL